MGEGAKKELLHETPMNDSLPYHVRGSAQATNRQSEEELVLPKGVL